MKISKKKTEVWLARKNMCFHSLIDHFGQDTVHRMRHGKNLLPKTVYKLSQILGCDPGDIVDLEET